MTHIFLLEDDLSLSKGLSFAFKKQGFEVTAARTLKDAELLWAEGRYELLVLDVALPDGTGFDFCKRVRQVSKVPIIFLTASDEEISIIMGLDIGADDYITKPFRVRELVARIKSVMRRCGKDKAEPTVKLGNVSVNLNEARVTKDNEDVILTAMEYRLLLTFINNRGKVLSRNRLLEEIWDVDGDFVNDNTLTVYIKRLRDKIERDPACPTIIKTVRGLGYVIENDR